MSKRLINVVIIFTVILSKTTILSAQLPLVLERILDDVTLSIGLEVDYFQWNKKMDTTFLDINWAAPPEIAPTEFTLETDYAPLLKPIVSIAYKNTARFSYTLFINSLPPFNNVYRPGPSRAPFTNYGERFVNDSLEYGAFQTYIGGNMGGQILQIEARLFPWLDIRITKKQVLSEEFRQDARAPTPEDYTFPVYGSFYVGKTLYYAGLKIHYSLGKWQLSLSPDWGLKGQIYQDYYEEENGNRRLDEGARYKGMGSMVECKVSYFNRDSDQVQGSWWYDLRCFYEVQDFGVINTDFLKGFTVGIYFDF